MSDHKPHPFGESGYPATVKLSAYAGLTNQIYTLGRQQPLSWGSNEFSRCQHVITWLHCTNNCLPQRQLVNWRVTRPLFYLLFGLQDVWLGIKYKHPDTFTSLYSLSLTTTKSLCRAAFLKKRTGRTVTRANISTSRGRCASNGNTITRSPFPWQWLELRVHKSFQLS